LDFGAALPNVTNPSQAQFDAGVLLVKGGLMNTSVMISQH
jgi:hypothetical protein